MNKHLENCSAPICQCDNNPNYKKEVVWYPGETICRHQPYQEFQKRQIKINDLARQKKFRKVEQGLTVNGIMRLKLV